MKWDELRRVLAKKLGATHVPGTKHDFWHVYCGEIYVGKVKDVKGGGEVRNHERGNIADSLCINENNLKKLVACTLTKEEFCQMQN